MENVPYVHVWNETATKSSFPFFFFEGRGGGGAEFPRPFYISFYIWKRNKGDVKFN